MYEIDGGGGSGWPKRLLEVEGGQSFPDGILGEDGQAMGTQLLHNMPSVGLDRFNAHMKVSSNLLRALAFTQELKHLAFPWG